MIYNTCKEIFYTGSRLYVPLMTVVKTTDGGAKDICRKTIKYGTKEKQGDIIALYDIPSRQQYISQTTAPAKSFPSTV